MKADVRQVVENTEKLQQEWNWKSFWRRTRPSRLWAFAKWRRNLERPFKYVPNFPYKVLNNEKRYRQAIFTNKRKVKAKIKSAIWAKSDKK